MRRLSVLIFFLFLFVLRLQFLPKIDLKDGQQVRVTGLLTEEPQVSGGQQHFKIGQFGIWTKRYPEYHYGEEVEVVGKVKTKTLFNSSLMSFKIFSLNQPKVKKISRYSVLSFKGAVIGLRVRLCDIFNRVLPKPYDGIISGIVLGNKSLISKDFWQKMQQTGTLHIMVASGMNIAMFSRGILQFFTLFFKRRVAILCLLCVIWNYSIMTGLAPPMVRAATMVSLIYLSHLTGREAEGGRVLFLTGMIMVFINPLLIFDVGFQLSFLATAGLVWIQPKLARRNAQYAKRRSFVFRIAYHVLQSDNFTSSLAAQIATLPILVLNFGQLNLLSPLINLIILWTVPYLLQFGMAIGILGLLWIKLAVLASYLVFPLLYFLEQTITFFAKIEIVQVQLPKIGWWFAVGYYFIIYLWTRENKLR